MNKDKVVFITGAASGIGYEIGIGFAKEGAKVAFSDLNEEKLNEVVNALIAEGYDCLGVKCDVTKEEDIQQAIDKTVERYGRIDVLVNNAGMQHVALIEDFPTERFELMTKIMLVAPFMAIKYVMPMMKEQGFGRIINMASINGVIGFAGKAPRDPSTEKPHALPARRHRADLARRPEPGAADRERSAGNRSPPGTRCPSQRRAAPARGGRDGPHPNRAANRNGFHCRVALLARRPPAEARCDPRP